MSEQDLTPDQLEQLREQLASATRSPAETDASCSRSCSSWSGPRSDSDIGGSSWRRQREQSTLQ